MSFNNVRDMLFQIAKRNYVSPNVIFCAFISFFSHYSVAKADFLDELFGTDSAPVVNRTIVRARRTGVGHLFMKPKHARAEAKVRTKVNFMPVRSTERHRHKLTVASVAHEIKTNTESSKPTQAALCAPEGFAINNAKSSTLFEYDKTLRSGDILVTETGVQIFRGQAAACPHIAQNFLALATLKVPRRMKKDLLIIEQTLHNPASAR